MINMYLNVNCVAYENEKRRRYEVTQIHIYKCRLLNKSESETDFENIFRNHYSTERAKQIVNCFIYNMKQREIILQKQNETKNIAISRK